MSDKSAPVSTFSSLIALLISVFVLITGNGLVNTLVPTRAKLEGFPDLAIGLIGSVYFIGMLLGTLAAPATIRRAGFIRAFAAFAAMAMVIATSFALFVNPWFWIGLRFVLGFTFAGVYAVIDAWVQAKATNTNRGGVYGLYQVVNFVGSAGGQRLLLVDDPKSFTLFSSSAILFALSILPLAITHAEPPNRPVSVRVRIPWLIRMSPIGAAAACCVGAANGAFWSLAPVYVLALGFDTRVVSDLTTAVVVGSTLLVWPLGRLSDRFDRRIIVVGLSLVAAALEAVLFLTPQPTHYFLVVLGFALGGAALVIYSIAAAQTNDRTGPDHAVEVSAGLLFLYCVGATAAPVVASALMQRFGPSALFGQNAAVHTLLAAFALWRISARARPVPMRREEASTKPPVP
jgi:MFS family permease